MAHVAKYPMASVGHLFKHFERAENVKFGNQSINAELSYLNYNLAASDQNLPQLDFLHKRLSEVKVQKRADVNVMCSWVLTAPKVLQTHEYELFFKSSYNFLQERYGKENIISAYVHFDEITPHMHFSFIPVVKDKKNDRYKVSAKECITRKDLQSFHRDLDKYLSSIFGKDIGILNEATKEGNLSIEELKRKSAVEQISEIKKQRSEAEIYLKNVQNEKNNIKVLLEEKDALKRQILDLEKYLTEKLLSLDKINNIKPQRTITGVIKGVSIDDIEDLKEIAINYISVKSNFVKLEKENEQLRKKIPSIQEREKNVNDRKKLQAYERIFNLLSEEEKRRLINLANKKEKSRNSKER